MLVPAFYFDGRTSRRHTVSLKVEDGIAVISGDAERRCPIDQLRVSERLQNAARKVTFPDGAYLEILDNLSFDRLLRLTGQRDSLTVRWQQSWRATALCAVATVFILLAGYRFGLPAFASVAAHALPHEIEHAMGREALALLDRRMFAPSELTSERQTAIRRRFSALATPDRRPVTAELVFRKSRGGPNAFTLPSGQVVLSDELVLKLDTDDAVIAVLAHEIGHLHHRHLMRRLIQGSATAAVATLLFGDVSAVVANMPTVLIDLKYSRDAEREADDYALALLEANGITGDVLVAALRRLDQARDEEAVYLSTHPSTAERVARIQGR